MAAATMTEARAILPALTVEEQQALAKAILSDAYALFAGKAGKTLAITNASGECITWRSKPVDIISFRMAAYRQCPALFALFLRRQGGAGLWDKLQAHFDATFPEVEL